jgi:hypothetical protein
LGNNASSSVWKVSSVPPLAIKKKLNMDKYLEFIEKVNEGAEWKLWERVIKVMTCVVYPILLPCLYR